MSHRVVIVGGGFGGLAAARRLGRSETDVTLIDRRNIHVFQPLLYQVATGGLSPGDISSPLRGVLRRDRNIRVWLGEATGLDAGARLLRLADETVPYDTLVVCVGAENHYFGHDDWARHAPSLKTLEDAVHIRRRVLLAFERAERVSDRVARDAYLTFVVVGAGPTGVELAGAFAELARDTLRHDFRSIDPRAARIVLVEGADRTLPQFPEELSARCLRHLERMGVEVRLTNTVSGIDADGVDLLTDRGPERLESKTVLWAAGVRAPALTRAIATATGAALDRQGRVVVAPDLSVPGHPEIFVIGDLAHVDDAGHALPGTAPVAIQQGRYVARAIRARLKGAAVPPFRYRNKGQLATIGRAAAVADFGKHLRFSGYPAWVLWLFIHLMYLVEFQNRVLVLIQWAWHYVTRNRGARIITEIDDGLSRPA